MPLPTALTAPPAYEPALATAFDTVGARASEILSSTHCVAIFYEDVGGFLGVADFLGPSFGGFRLGCSLVCEAVSESSVTFP